MPQADMLKTVPDIIKAAAASNLAILALLILVVAVLAYTVLRKATPAAQFGVFVMTFAGVGLFGYRALQLQREEAVGTQNALRLKESKIVDHLTLSLRFVGGPANPFAAQAHAFVQKVGEAKPELHDDLVQFRHGVGGIKADFSRLTIGDMMYVVVRQGNRTWRSDDLQMLEAHLEMNPQTSSAP